MFSGGLNAGNELLRHSSEFTALFCRDSGQCPMSLWSPQWSNDSLPGQWPWAKYMPYMKRYYTALYRWYSLRTRTTWLKEKAWVTESLLLAEAIVAKVAMSLFVARALFGELQRCWNDNFSWQPQYLVNLQRHCSWQALFFDQVAMMLERRFLGQVQYFVTQVVGAFMILHVFLLYLGMSFMAGTLFGQITVLLECYFSWQQAQFGELALSIFGEVAVMLESHFSWQMQRSFISSFVALVTFLFCITALYWMFHVLPLSNTGVVVTVALHHIGCSA